MGYGGLVSSRPASDFGPPRERLRKIAARFCGEFGRQWRRRRSPKPGMRQRVPRFSEAVSRERRTHSRCLRAGRIRHRSLERICGAWCVSPVQDVATALKTCLRFSRRSALVGNMIQVGDLTEGGPVMCRQQAQDKKPKRNFDSTRARHAEHVQGW